MQNKNTVRIAIIESEAMVIKFLISFNISLTSASLFHIIGDASLLCDSINR